MKLPDDKELTKLLRKHRISFDEFQDIVRTLEEVRWRTEELKLPDEEGLKTVLGIKPPKRPGMYRSTADGCLWATMAAGVCVIVFVIWMLT